MATSTILLTTALLTATMGPIGLSEASSLAPVRGSTVPTASTGTSIIAGILIMDTEVRSQSAANGHSMGFMATKRATDEAISAWPAMIRAASMFPGIRTGAATAAVTVNA